MKLKKCKIGQKVRVIGDIDITCEIVQIYFTVVDIKYDTGEGCVVFRYVNPRFLKPVK